jgi:putrescine transport system substrate-binding protein
MLRNVADGLATASALVDPTIASDPAIYPDAETLSRLYTPKPQTAEQDAAITRIWTDIKAGG